MLSVAEAKQRILADAAALAPEQVSVADALGRVLAEDVAARVTQPPAAVSAMDGYAVRAADVASVPATLRVIGSVPAGQFFEGRLGAGEAVRIFTGAPLPAGADAIVIQEDTEADGDTVVVKDSAPEGHYVRPAGLDFRAGDVQIRKGTVLTARDVGLAAAMNVPWLAVTRRPRVAILPTGDEIAMPGDPLAPHHIVSSNGLALSAFVQAEGGQPVHLRIARDNRESLAVMAAGARGADLFLTTGGASVGEHDLVSAVLGEVGLELDFWRIAMRPGKPLMFGRIGDTPMLGLPGNPVSSMVCAVIFLRPLLRRLLGRGDPDDAPATARLGGDLGANDRREDYLRARLSTDGNGGLVATPFDRQDSSMFATLAHADCLVVRPPNAPPAKAGETVAIVPLTGSIYSL
jgi:molybdopterin molybdotransferase